MSGTTSKTPEHTFRPDDVEAVQAAWFHAGGKTNVGQDVEQLVRRHSLGAVLDAIWRVREADGLRVWSQIGKYLDGKGK